MSLVFWCFVHHHPLVGFALHNQHLHCVFFVFVSYMFRFSKTSIYSQTTSWIVCHQVHKGKFFFLFLFHLLFLVVSLLIFGRNQINFKIFAKSLFVVLLSLALVSLFFPCSNIHKSWIFTWKIKLVICFSIIQKSLAKHFFIVPFHML